MPSEFTSIDLATLNTAQGAMVTALRGKVCQWEQDSADAALSSFLARRVMVVAATPVITAREFIVIALSPVSALRRFALAIALARVIRTCFAISAPYPKHCCDAIECFTQRNKC